MLSSSTGKKSRVYLEENLSDSVGFQLNELSKIIEKTEAGAAHVEIDFRNVKFLNPTVILGIASLIFTYRKKGITCETISVPTEIQGYLNTIKFPNGIFPHLEVEWETILNNYDSKNYLPIINFPADSSNDSTSVRDAVLSKVANIIHYKLNLPNLSVAALHYFITEFAQNIVEHADVTIGRIMVQFYPIKGYIEICIIDEGKSLLRSYLDNRRFEIITDQDAIRAALSGISTKKQDHERGYGIHTSNNLIVNGMKGKVFVVSGKGMLANTTVIPYKSTWSGTLLSVKIPMNMEKFNIYDYIS